MRTTPIGLWAALAALALAKLGLILWAGPLTQPDTGLYTAYARLILDGGPSLGHLDLRHPDVSTIRAIGYPAFLAAVQRVAGESWAWMAIGLQSLLGVVAVALLFRAGRALAGSTAAGLLAAGCYAVSPALQFDLSLLTDSLYGHLLAILTALLVLWAVEERPATPGRLLAAGGLLALSLLVREATLPLGLLFAAPVAVWAGRGGWTRGLAAIGLFLAPLLLTVVLYQGWNQLRTGEAFIATDARWAVLNPLLVMEARGTPVFTGTEALDTAAARVYAAIGRPANDSNDEIAPRMFALAGELLTTAQLTEVEAMRVAKQRLMREIVAHPLAAAGILVRKLTSKVALTPCDPLRVWRRIADSRDSTPAAKPPPLLQRPLSTWHLGEVVALLLEGATRLFALVLVAGFLATPVLTAAAALKGEGGAALRLALFVVAAGFIGVYALVYLEERYIIGVLPALLLAALTALPELGRRLRIPRQILPTRRF